MAIAHAGDLPIVAHLRLLLKQNLLLARDEVINLPVVEVKRTRDEGGWWLVMNKK